MTVFKQPPRNRHFLAKVKQYHYSQHRRYPGFVQVLPSWKEFFWDGETYRQFCGKESVITTGGSEFDEWAELPVHNEIYNHSEI